MDFLEIAVELFLEMKDQKIENVVHRVLDENCLHLQLDDDLCPYALQPKLPSVVKMNWPQKSVFAITKLDATEFLFMRQQRMIVYKMKTGNRRETDYELQSLFKYSKTM